MATESWTVLDIKVKLCTDNKWLIRGLLAIYRLQTEDEQHVGITLEHNGAGFNGVDASILSSCAKQVISGRELTEKQMMLLRKKMVKYAGQLKMIADNNLRGD